MSFSLIKGLLGSQDARLLTVSSSEKKEQPFGPDEILQAAKKIAFPISPNQFAYRTVPAYLEKNKLGMSVSTKDSVLHWIALISLWLKDEAKFISLNITKPDLQYLHDALKEYLATIDAFHSQYFGHESEYHKAAVEVIKWIKERSFARKRGTYVYFGYEWGPNNGGHAITTKWVHQGKKIEACFLNLGEGANMHARLGWSATSPHIHFQSFPVLIDLSTFDTDKAVDVFGRLIRLEQEKCRANTEGYKAEDIYVPIYSLGQIQSSFASNPQDRASKPQDWEICSDMAVSLLIKDVLIDLGYKKQDIQRLFCLEKFCDILFFANELNAENFEVKALLKIIDLDSSLDGWLLFKTALQEFSIRTLKVCESALQEKELETLHVVARTLFGHAKEKIDTLVVRPLSFSALEEIENKPCLFFECNDYYNLATSKLEMPQPSSLYSTTDLPDILVRDPKTIKITIKEYAEIAKKLSSEGQIDRACEFVYEIMLSLPVPTLKKDFWDEVEESDLGVLIESFFWLSRSGINPSQPGNLIYRNALVLVTGYAIIDKLVRRKYPQYFKGFYSPFYPTSFDSTPYSYLNGYFSGVTCKKKEHEFFDFSILHFKNANVHWVAIRNYFEGMQKGNSHALFCVTRKSIDLSASVLDYQKREVYSTWKLEDQYLKFLEQFFESSFSKEESVSFSILTKFALLWENKGCKYLPAEIDFLYWIAKLSDEVFNGKTLSSHGPDWRSLVEQNGKRYINYKSPINKDEFDRHKLRYLDVDFQLSPASYYRKETENQSQIKEIAPRSPWSTKTYREWVRIFTNPDLQISSVMLWMSNNFSLLQLPAFQACIESALFEPGLLAKKIEEESETLLNLRALFKDALMHYQSSYPNVKTVFFLIRLGICLESYAEKPSLETLSFYESILLKETKVKECASLAFAHLLLLYQVHLPSPDSLSQLIKAFFFRSYTEPSSKLAGMLKRETVLPMQKHEKSLKAACKDEKWAEHVFNSLFEFLFPHLPIPSGECRVNFPILEKGEYSFNLVSGLVFKGTSQLLYLLESFRTVDSSLSGLIWVEKGVYFSETNHVRIRKESSGQFTLAKKFPELGFEEWFDKIDPQSSSLGSTLLSNGEIFDHFASQTRSVICRKDEKKPLYLSEDVNNQVIVRKIMPDHTFAYQLIKLEKETPLASFFFRLGNPKEVCLWYDEKTNCVAEIDLLELKLTFKRVDVKGKWKYQCVSFPEYFLAEEQVVPELDFFQSGLVLEKGKDKALLLPIREIKRTDESFFSLVSFESKFFSKYEFFYIYQIDELTKVLVHPKPDANFFLCLLCAEMRDFQKAFFYLKRANSFNYLSEETLGGTFIASFTELKDFSPEALAFYLKLGVHIIENAEQIIPAGFGTHQDGPGSKKGFIKDNIFIWIGDILNKYLRVVSTKEVSRVPAYIRLTQKEESLLFHYLKKFLSDEDKKNLVHLTGYESPPLFFTNYVKHFMPNPRWSESFDVRISLLEKGNWNFRILPSQYFFRTRDSEAHFLIPQNVYLNHPPFFKGFNQPDNFVRCTDSHILSCFIPLYERIKKGDGELDVFYLQRSYNRENGHIVKIYSFLLKYVHEYPDEFAHLTFSDDELNNKKVFEEIVAVAFGIVARLSQVLSTMGEVFFGYSIFFKYQKGGSVALPQARPFEKLSWTFKDGTSSLLCHEFKQLANLFGPYFEIARNPSIDSKIPFAFSNKTSGGWTRQQLIKDLHASYLLLQQPKSGETLYLLKQNYSLKDIKELAFAQLKEKKEKLFKIKKSAEEKANSYPNIDFRIGLRKIGRDLEEIKIEGILSEAYLSKNLMLIRKANPSLKPSDIEEVLLLTVQYHLTRIHINQLEKGIALLEKNHIQGFVESLAVYGDINPLEEPEIFIYQSRSGKTLWKSQADLFSWEIATTKELPKIRLFSIAAGQGKTSFYLPPALMRIKRQGYMPITVSPKSLYQVDRQGLQETSNHFFSFDMRICEVDLNSELLPSDYKWIYEEITRYQDTKGLKLIPESLFALHLKYQLALEMGDSESVKWLSLIFDVFENKGVAFIDECGITCSPMRQAKIGIGKPLPLHPVDRKLFLEIYRSLIDPKILLNDGMSVRDVVRLQDNFQALMDSKERKSVKEAVINDLVHRPFFNIPDKEKNAVVSFWKGEGKEPGYIQGLNPEQRRAILLVKSYFEDYFKTAMKLVWRMNHVQSLKDEEEIHVPAWSRQALKAYYEDVYLTLIATIQGVLQEGLTYTQSIKLLNELEKKHHSEIGASDKFSEIERSFQIWINDPKVRFNQFSCSDHRTTEVFYGLTKNNPDCILWYLEHVVLGQIVFCPEQLSVTPFYLLQSFFKSVTLFSAEPGSEEIFGIYDKGPNVRKDPLFLSHTIHHLMREENSQLISFDLISTADDFFEALFMYDPKIFSDLRMICDAGGMLKFTTKQIVEAFFNFIDRKNLDFDGIIIFDEASTRETATDLFFWLKDWGFPKRINTHDVPAALKSIGLNWNNLKLLTLIDPSHRAGANIEQPSGSSILVLMGEDLSISDFVQGVLRGRGVLKKEQKVIWGASKKLMKKILNDKQPSSERSEAFDWMLDNEDNSRNRAFLVSALHQIEYWIAEPVWKKIKDPKVTPSQKIAIWKKYRNGFARQAEVDPIQKKQIDMDPKGGLWSYAKELYRAFGFDEPFDKASSLHKKLTPIIDAFQKKNLSFSKMNLVDAARSVYMHAHQKQEIKKEQIVSKHSQIEVDEAEPLPSWLTLSYNNFLYSLVNRSKSAQTLFDSKNLSPNLWFTEGAIHTAKSGGNPLLEEYLKPVQYILLYETKNEKYAFALSDQEAILLHGQLVSAEIKGSCFALINVRGGLVQNGKGKSAFSKEKLTSLFVQDVVMDVSLTRCDLVNLQRFIKRLETWSDFWPMWEKIKRCQPLQNEIRAGQIEKLALKAVKKEKIDNKSFSFFGLL